MKVRQDATIPVRYLCAVGIGRERNATRRNGAGNEIKRRSESTTMRYSQPPFKEFSCF